MIPDQSGYPPTMPAGTGYPPTMPAGTGYPGMMPARYGYTPAVGHQTVVISPQFCMPYPVDLTIVRKLFQLSEGNFGVTDVNGNMMFHVKGKLLSLRDRRVLYDAVGNPIITFHQKVLSAHRRWLVYRAQNTKEDVCDFKIEGSWFERSCVIKAGNSSNILAQMHRKHSVQSIVLGQDTFGISVYPNVEYAFIVALVVILEEINQDRSGKD